MEIDENWVHTHTNFGQPVQSVREQKFSQICTKLSYHLDQNLLTFVLEPNQKYCRFPVSSPILEFPVKHSWNCATLVLVFLFDCEQRSPNQATLLLFQVRRMTGALVAVGQGKISLTKLKDILESRDSLAYPHNVVAPARGLFLTRVDYRESGK